MSERQHTETLRASCVHWAKQNATGIEAALHSTFLRSFGLLRRDVQDKSLSEQKLCKSIDKLSLPIGFSLVPQGNVAVYDSNGEILVDTVENHHFAACGDFVICITPGQFFDPQQWENAIINRPGDRLRIYQYLAPNIITLLHNNLGVLHGTMSEIQERLHLRYS